MAPLISDPSAAGQIRTIEAEILFDNDAARQRAKAALEQAGFEVEMFAFVLEDAPSWAEESRWAKARRVTDVSFDDFINTVDRILDEVRVERHESLVLSFGLPYPIPSEEAVLAALGDGAYEQTLMDALETDIWTLDVVLTRMQQGGLVRRIPCPRGISAALIVPSVVMQ